MSRQLRASSLKPHVREVLARGAFAGLVYRLPSGQLDRKMYVEVNEALEALGGKWNRKLGGHVFADDPTDLFASMLDTGVVPAKNPDAFFPTPPVVVAEIIRHALLDDATAILEPSAGTGAIALEANRVAPLGCVVHCVELNEKRASDLSNAGLLHVWNSDFLEWDEGLEKYDRILMNPPFAVDGDATAWLTHLERALEFLAKGGRLVCVVPSSYAFRGSHQAFRDSIKDWSFYLPLPEDSFKDSGTGVNCGLLIVDGVA